MELWHAQTSFKASGHAQSAAVSWNQVEKWTSMKNSVQRKAKPAMMFGLVYICGYTNLHYCSIHKYLCLLFDVV